MAIFFVISGFLLYRPFVKARFRGESLPHVRAYAWRRFLRIVPGYWVALIAIAIWLGLSNVFTASGIVRYFGFLQVYSDSTTLGGIGQAWTLCVEVTFYILLPLWALALRRRRNASLRSELMPLALMFAAGVAYGVWAVHHNGVHQPSPYFKTLPAYLDQFALGMALAVLSAWDDTREGATRVPALLRRLADRVPSAPWLAAAAAFAAVVAVTVHGNVAAYMWRHELYSLVAVGVVAPAILFPAGRGVAGRVLSTRVLLYVGLWSYALYLYHPQVIVKLVRPVHGALPSGAGWDALGLSVAGLAVCLPIAAASYYLVERPALRLKDRVRAPHTTAARGEAIAEPAPVLPPRT